MILGQQHQESIYRLTSNLFNRDEGSGKTQAPEDKVTTDQKEVNEAEGTGFDESVGGRLLDKEYLALRDRFLSRLVTLLRGSNQEAVERFVQEICGSAENLDAEG